MIDDGPMLFVCGMSRSGTTLLATLFDAHPRIAMGYELIPPPGLRIGGLSDAMTRGLELADGDFLACGRALRAAADHTNGLMLTRCARAGLTADETRGALDRLTVDGLDEVTSVPERLRVASGLMKTRQEREDAALFGFKLNMPSLELARGLFPGAHFACIARDPRDVVASHRKRGFDRSLEEICHAWVTNVSAAERIVADHPASAVLVRYEDLVSEPEVVLPYLFEALPVPLEDSVFNFARSDAAVFRASHPNEAQLRRGFFTTQIGSWEEALDQGEIAKIQKLCGERTREYYSDPVKTARCAESWPMQLESPAQERLAALAEIRGESVADVVERFGTAECRRIPGGILKHAKAVAVQTFSASGVEDGAAYVELPNGRRFFGHLSQRTHRREYDYVADVVSPALSADTYLVAKDVTMRYLTDYSWYPRDLLPGPGGVVVEVGAYLGHKTVRFVDECVGESGQVMAIEVMPDNAALLRRNVDHNGLQDCVEVIECGVWNRRGVRSVTGRGRQRQSLVSLEHLDPTRSDEVVTDTLDNLLAAAGYDAVDFMIVTANGAEYEIIQGLEQQLASIKVLFIAAPYQRDGRASASRCIDLLISRGMTILPRSRGSKVFAIWDPAVVKT